MAELQYFKTDKNGTKYYYDYTCPRCGGAGQADKWMYTGYVCFECGGTGKRPTPKIVKEYTPEYQEELDKKRAERNLKKLKEQQERAKANAPKNNQIFFKKNGFNSDGEIYFFLGDTYSMKEQIKSVGGKFNYAYGWYIDHEVEGFDLLMLTADEICGKNAYGEYIDILRDDVDLNALKKQAWKEVTNVPESEYYGEVGQKVDLELTYVDRFNYETNFTYRGEIHTIFKFVNNAGQIFVWNTQSYIDKLIDDNKGDEFRIAGTIKSHSEYDGEKQTVLTRCKVF